jgi:hypothetical protein
MANVILVATLEALKTVSINITVFWDMTPTSLLDDYRIFGGT